ncbi:hypothetical protein CGRA01v4_03803 [Colletotrichum graminicola]|nr:hypothetical protein CGRA01v4_03803 [Colletotrichum graminicola]
MRDYLTSPWSKFETTPIWSGPGAHLQSRQRRQNAVKKAVECPVSPLLTQESKSKIV